MVFSFVGWLIICSFNCTIQMPGKGSKRDAKVTWWGDLSGQLKRSTAPCPLLLSADTVEKLRLLLDPEISSGQINWYEQREVCILVVRQLLAMLEAENSNYLLEQFPPWILIVIFRHV